MRHPHLLTPKSKTHEVTPITAGTYEVTSGHTGNVYTVTLLDTGAACSCDWSKYRPASNGGKCGCSHTLAVFAFIQSQENRTVKAHATRDTAKRQHRHLLDIGDGLILTTRKAG